MDAIISSIITPVVDSLIVPVKKHLGFLVSSTKYVKDMKEKMDQLNLIEQDIQHDWEEAVTRNHEVSHHVSPWLEKVKELNENTQSIPTGDIGCFNIAKRYKAGKQSFNILEEIQVLKTWKSEIVFTKEQIPLAEVVSISTGPSTSTQNNFESRELIYKAALECLQPNNESHKMIALCGMGGVGKTTMMEQLKKEVVFDRVVKVVVGENTDLIALQRAIAKDITLEDLKEEDKDARADRLCTMFGEMSKQGKKTLVIMDDLWNEFDLKDVGLSPLPNGFKILFTSRDKRICTQMGVRSNSIFTVGILNEVEAKSLFFGIVGLSDGDDPPLQKIGEDIVNKCGGLPIAIVTIAKSLSDNIKEAWEKALWRLKQDDLKDLESIPHRIFELSYENLKEEGDKSIFLLSGLFPDDFNIRVEDLVRYGWGLGFFKDANTFADARRDMKIYVNNLIRANLLSESDRMGCVKMHDLVRAFVLSNFSKVKQASIVNHDNKLEKPLTKDANESYQRILLNCKGIAKFPVGFNYPNLSMLMLMDGYELIWFPEDIYERMKKLEVLSYENMHIPLLPIAFEHLSKLRTLFLHSCSFINDDISFIGNLSNLETLSFVKCQITRLPSMIGKLKKLKLLDVTGCSHLGIDDGVFQNLVSLEELYMRVYNGKPVRFTDTTCDELEILSKRLFALELEFFRNNVKPKNVSFTNLKRFRISIGCQLTELEDKEEYLYRNTIQFVGDYNELRECNISDQFEKTEELCLTVNGMDHLEDHSFSNLTVLHVSECANLTYLFTVNVASGLKKLQCLTVSSCPAMRTVVAETSRGDEVITFGKLEFMSLSCLPKLVSLWDNVIELPEIVELEIGELPNFTSIYPYSDNKFEMQSLLNKKVMIPKLEKLHVFRMENLKQIWSCEENNIFPSNSLLLINQLEELEVEDCGSIEVLFNIDSECVISGMGEYKCKLRSIQVDKLGKLKELWRIKGVNNSDILIDCFKGVESIRISDCSVFKNIFTPATTKFDLGGLTTYDTVNTGKEMLKAEISEMDGYIPNVTYPSYLLRTCHHLQDLSLHHDKRVEEVVFEMDSEPLLLLPYLQSIELVELKEMSHVWKCNNWNTILTPQHHQPFQNLTDIYLMNCDKIKYLFSPLMAKYLSNLKSVHIRWCDGMEEVISSRDDENEENTTSTSSTFFPHLVTIQLFYLPCLKSVDTRSRSNKISSNINTDHDQSQQSGQVIGACWSLCQFPTNITIVRCKSLSSLVPWYAAGQMERLQQLEINMCSRMREVFESEPRSTNNVDGTSTTLTTATLRHIPQLSNLQKVRIIGCKRLSHIFNFSTLESLKQLKLLEVKRCKAIQVIVQEEKSSEEEVVVVVFPCLKTLVLDDLPNIKGFFLGMNEFRWPSLDDLFINNCPNLMIFTAGHSNTPKLNYVQTIIGRYSLESYGINFNTTNKYQNTFPNSSSEPTISNRMHCSFHNLIEINIHREDDVTTIVPSDALRQLEKLQQITIKLCDGLQEVFEVVALEGTNKSQTVVKIPNLKQVRLELSDGLRYLWKSNQWMVLDFPNLTTVSIDRCGSLKHVFTCSMVGSLVQLQELHISKCKNIDVIVKEEEEKCDAKVNEIVLPRLKSLRLDDLSRLEGFCLGKKAFSLPMLETLQIERCPAIINFTKGHLSVPERTVIDTIYGKWYVKPNLNSFIKNKQEEWGEF